MKEKNDNNTIFIPLNNDNEWVSVKRDINYRLVYNDKIVKKIKYKFVKQIQKQKNSNQIYFIKKMKNKKGEKTNVKSISKKNSIKLLMKKMK